MLDRLIESLVQLRDEITPWHVVDQFEEGVVLRFGKFHRKLDAGFHWVAPFLEKVMVADVVPTVLDLPVQSLATKDGVEIVISGVVTYKIYNVQKALLDISTVKQAVHDSCKGEIGRHVRRSTWEDVQAEDFEDKLQEACHKRATVWGVRIVSLQMADLTRSGTLRLAGLESRAPSFLMED